MENKLPNDSRKLYTQPSGSRQSWAKPQTAKYGQRLLWPPYPSAALGKWDLMCLAYRGDAPLHALPYCLVQTPAERQQSADTR